MKGERDVAASDRVVCSSTGSGVALRAVCRRCSVDNEIVEVVPPERHALTFKNVDSAL